MIMMFIREGNNLAVFEKPSYKPYYIFILVIILMLIGGYYYSEKAEDRRYDLVSEKLNIPQSQFVIRSFWGDDTYTVISGETKYKVKFNIFNTQIEHFAEERS